MCYNISMSFESFLIVALILLVFVAVVYDIACSKGYGATSYRRRFGKHYKLGKLLTKNEYSFYMKLRKQLPNDIIVCPKVRMEDFLDIIAKDKNRYRGYVRSRHIDFMICDEKLNIICGLELDDSSHQTKKARKADRLKNDVFKEIGVPLLRAFNNSKDINNTADRIKKLNKRN